MADIYDKLNFNSQERVYIHNEIFNDLGKNKNFTAKNIVFVYVYYCIICYLYRYCKYGEGYLFNNEDIKEMMGYKRKYGGVDYLIKKGGVLDHIGYTECIRDFPVEFRLEDKYVEFEMYSDLDKELKNMLSVPRNFYIKKPVAAFNRENYETGTFNDISDTHLFDMGALINMMRSEMSINEFFVYQYFRCMTDKFKDGFSASYEKIEGDVKMSVRSLKRVIPKLEQSGYLYVERDELKGKETKPNLYRLRK